MFTTLLWWAMPRLLLPSDTCAPLEQCPETPAEERCARTRCGQRVDDEASRTLCVPVIKKKEKVLLIKGRKFKIKDYYNGIAKFDFNDLCNKNIGAEDYIKIAEVCSFIIIENLPNFKEDNSNQQLRFILLIDIIYEKKISLAISSICSLQNLTSANSLSDSFKRTSSRLYELTS